MSKYNNRRRPGWGVRPIGWYDRLGVNSDASSDTENGFDVKDDSSSGMGEKAFANYGFRENGT